MFRRPSVHVEQPDAGLSLEEMEIEQQILKVLTDIIYIYISSHVIYVLFSSKHGS